MLGLSVPAAGEPSATSNYLMNEPVSVMDFAIYKLQLDLNDVFVSDANLDRLWVEYDWKSDRIIIDVSIGNNKNNDRGVLKKISTHTIKVIKEYIGTGGAVAAISPVQIYGEILQISLHSDNCAF